MHVEHSFPEISDVRESTRVFISTQWGWKYYGPGIALTLVGLLLFPLFIGAIAWWTIGFAFAYLLAERAFMRQFAARNGMHYEETGDLSSLIGTLFGRGHSRRMTHVVVGNYAGLPLRVFFYQYTVGSGKSSQTYQFTVIETCFSGLVPNFILDARQDWLTDSTGETGYRKLSLGAPFDDSFHLFVPEDLEIEVLEVLTPEIMEYLLRDGSGYNFEFIRDRLLIWKHERISKRETLDRYVDFTRFLLEKIAPRLQRLHDDIVALKRT